MADTFDAFDYLAHLRVNWKFVAAVCAIALVLAGTIAFFLPAKYTAVVKIVIDPPGGSDQRVAVAVSPIYLESLRSYEHFASSDSLFEQALIQCKIRQSSPGRSIESWKRSVLKVEIPRNTKVLEIHATLRDAALAHNLALYIAHQTIELTRTVNNAPDDDLIHLGEQQLAEARAKLDRVTADFRRAAAQGPVEGLRSEIDSAVILRDQLRREPSTPPQKLQTLDAEIARKQTQLAERTANREVLLLETRSAESAVADTEERLRNFRATAGRRGEQLTIIDPGITPERPSSPNVPLILISALVLALVASLVYLTIEFGYQSRKNVRAAPALRVAARNG